MRNKYLLKTLWSTEGSWPGRAQMQASMFLVVKCFLQLMIFKILTL